VLNSRKIYETMYLHEEKMQNLAQSSAIRQN
jgi:hypothetical protein